MKNFNKKLSKGDIGGQKSENGALENQYIHRYN